MLPRAKYKVIVLDDSKQDGVYWRGIVFAGYKGTRTQESARDVCYQSIRDIGWALIKELNFPVYSEPLFEADDWAGLVYRLKTSADHDSLLWTRELYLSTVDSDWLQLVDDDASILWANTGPWPSRLKNESETRQYVLKRMGLRITKPREIALVKQRQGDDADELPAGSDLSLFDLCSVNEKYNIDTLPQAADLLKHLSDPEPNTSHTHLHKAVAWCNANGLPIVCRP